MSGNSEPIETEQQSDVIDANAAALVSHRRILWAMAAVTIFGGLLGFIFVSREFGAGVLFGGGLSLVNYYWLKSSLRGIFDKAVSTGERPRFFGGTYFLRYLAFGTLLLIVFLTKVLPIIAVLLGLASFAFAIIVEAFILLFLSVFKK